MGKQVQKSEFLKNKYAKPVFPTYETNNGVAVLAKSFTILTKMFLIARPFLCNTFFGVIKESVIKRTHSICLYKIIFQKLPSPMWRGAGGEVNSHLTSPILHRVSE